MEILKHGNQHVKNKVHFECEVCGCSFIANSSEYHTGICSLTKQLYYYCECPDCKCIVERF